MSEKLQMNEEAVVALMSGSKSKAEWERNCDEVKRAFGHYPDFWYTAIVCSGVISQTAAKFGETADIKLTPLYPKE